ncbi:TIGR02757 family protein [Hyphobacterium sp. CCMP332]|nr:TIGR02757 family protein [Hyphobacterium sp. CCMP332]
MKHKELKELLDEAYNHYSSSDFIVNDPIQIPHAFTLKQDIEITAFFAAMLAWGQRITIINKSKELFRLMDNAPYSFVIDHSESDLKPLMKFKHRTFNTTDLLHFISFLNYWFSNNESLETAFSQHLSNNDTNVEKALIGFHKTFFSLKDSPERTRKHVATPARKSACKRLNMFLRWMVRKDEYGIDFGMWKSILPRQLVCPFDVHVSNVSRDLGLVKRKPGDWQTALELTENLKKFDPLDPVKYDIALFGIGINVKIH